MKTAEEWLDIWTERMQTDPGGPDMDACNEWFMRQNREHLEAIRDEQREKCAEVYWHNADPEHRSDQLCDDISYAGKAD